MLLYAIDETIAKLYHAMPCLICARKMYRGNYIRKPRGIPIEVADYFAYRFSHCCSGCRKRRTPPSARFLGRRVYVAAFMIMIFYQYIEEEERRQHEQLMASISLGMASITLDRWINWWSFVVPVSSVWKKICGVLSANTHGDFLPHFILNQFIKDSEKKDKAVLALLEFLSPMAVPKDYPPSD